MSDSEFFMKQALKYANRAKKQEEVPIGAIVVDQSKRVIGIGWNQIERKKCQIVHAEAMAVKKATKTIGDWRLDGCTLYVTLEPCMMCLGLIHLSRISRCVFGAKSRLFAINEFYNKQYANHICFFEGGILEEESSVLLKEFFKETRLKNSFNRQKYF